MPTHKPGSLKGPLRCAEPSCEATHPNAAEGNKRYAGWRCSEHDDYPGATDDGPSSGGANVFQRALPCAEPGCELVHPTATKEHPGEDEGWLCYKHNPKMKEPLKCAAPGCDVIHPNGVAADTSLIGWVCRSHEARFAQPTEPVQPRLSRFELIEALADIEHARWSRWEVYRSENNTPENTIRWSSLRETPYADLPEHSKESDRVEANITLEKLASLGALRELPELELGGNGGDYQFEVKAQKGPLLQQDGQDYELPTMCFSTGAGAWGGVHGSFIFQFGQDHDAAITLRPDGTVEYGSDYKPSKVAKEFWSVFAFLVPLELSTLGRCARIAMSRGVNAMAGRDQALELGNGNLAATLHMVGRAFQEYAGDIKRLSTEMPTEVSPHELLESVKPLVKAAKDMYVVKERLTNKVDDIGTWAKLTQKLLEAYEQVHAKLRTGRV